MRALVVSADGEPHRLSDPQLAELTRRIAAGLHARGVGPGDVVLVRLPKGAEWLCLLRALYRIGAVKRAETRARKIADFVAMLERHETLH